MCYYHDPSQEGLGLGFQLAKKLKKTPKRLTKDTCSRQYTCLHHKGLKVGLYMYFSFSSGLDPSVPFM